MAVLNEVINEITELDGKDYGFYILAQSVITDCLLGNPNQVLEDLNLPYNMSKEEYFYTFRNMRLDVSKYLIQAS